MAILKKAREYTDDFEYDYDYNIEDDNENYISINDFVNEKHDNDTLIEKNEFYEKSSFIGKMNEKFFLYEDEYIIFKISCSFDPFINNKKFIKASNNIPKRKYLKKDLEDLKELFGKYGYKIDCDGNLYFYEDDTYTLVGYYDYKKGKMRK